MGYKIVWHSNAPWNGSGYGNQTQLFTSCMVNDSDFEEPIVSSNYGLRGTQIKAQGVRVLPGAFEPHGADILTARYDSFKPDAFIGLYDVWVFPDDILASRPFTWWTPVDHHPIPEMVANKLTHVKYPWSMSKHGHDQMNKVGVLNRYVPHGCDTTVYHPMNRTESRAKFSFLEGDEFFIVSVAANKGQEDRKNLRTMVHAFAQFLLIHPQSKLYLHTMQDPQHHDGINLKRLVGQLGLENKVFFPDAYNITEGLYPPKYLNTLYNAADVFLLPSCGEGFGIPVIEAQAAGCPVIVNDFTAQGELVGSGYKIAIDSDDYEYSLYGSYRARVRTSKIVAALKLSLEWKDDEPMRESARGFVVSQYDYQHVWATHMKPAIVKQIEWQRKLESDREQRTVQRLGMREQSKQHAIMESIVDVDETRELITQKMMKDSA